jgi:hypothetical protein
MKRAARSALWLIAVAVLSGATAGCSGDEKGSPAPIVNKALIEVGWDAPTPDHLRANITTMEQRPFNGVMVNLNAGKTIFNKTAYPDDAFTQDRADLAATTFTKLTDNFVTIWSAREEGWDWFNDKHWSAAQTNASNFAETAKAGDFEGFIFDPEPYGTNPWSYNAELYPTTSFADVQAKVRQRGASFLTALQGEMPDVTVLMLFGASHVKQQADDRGVLEEAEWVLLASFVDGMLDVINPEAELIDGNELSYYNTRATDFDEWREFQQSARELISPENREKYDAQVGTAHAVFVDGLLNLLQSPRFFGYYLESDEQRQQFLEHNTYHALRASDRYAWVYNEHVDWWGTNGNGVQLPEGLEDLLDRASSAANNNQPLGFEIDTFMPGATGRFDAKVTISGQVLADGVGVAGVVMRSGEPVFDSDPSCVVSYPDGYYACTVPSGWSGTLVPEHEGLTFTPAEMTFTNLTDSPSNQDFAVG